MLAPPNKGSEIVDRLGQWALFRLLFGSTATQLGTSSTDLPATLPVPPVTLGVIAGNRWLNPLGPLILPRPHDGTVSVSFGLVLPAEQSHYSRPSPGTAV